MYLAAPLTELRINSGSTFNWSAPVRCLFIRVSIGWCWWWCSAMWRETAVEYYWSQVGWLSQNTLSQVKSIWLNLRSFQLDEHALHVVANGHILTADAHICHGFIQCAGARSRCPEITPDRNGTPADVPVDWGQIIAQYNNDLHMKNENAGNLSISIFQLLQQEDICTNCINIDVTASELAFSQAELLTCGTVYLSLSYLPACLPLNGLLEPSILIGF